MCDHIYDSPWRRYSRRGRRYKNGLVRGSNIVRMIHIAVVVMAKIALGVGKMVLGVDIVVAGVEIVVLFAEVTSSR